MLRKTVEVLGRRKDLRVAVLLAQAALERDGFEGFAIALDAIRRLVDTFWEGIHPRLDPEDDNDPSIRINVLMGLCDAAVLRALRSAPLIKSRAFGAISLRHVAALTSKTPPPAGSPVVDAASIAAAAKDAAPGSVASTAKAIKETRGHLAAIGAVFETKGKAQGPDFGQLSQLLDQAYKAVSSHVPAAPADKAVGAATQDGAGDAAAAQVPKISGEIESRDDVLKAIERICAYYVRHEPASPVPLLMERCRKLVTMSFLDIVRDMAPDAVAKVEVITGKQEIKK